MSDSTDHYKGTLLEDMNHKFDVILEYLSPLPVLYSDVAQLKEDMAMVKSDIQAIKAVARDHSDLLSDHTRQLLNHGGRLTKLEHPA